MHSLRKWLAFALLVTGLLLLTYISARLPGQADLTAEKIYTLSQGTRDLLGGLEEPVTLRFYFSRNIPGLPTQFKNFATQVEDLLRQYAAAGSGKIALEVIDPKPDSDEEQAAIRAGLEGLPLSNGESLFFGLQAIQADQEKVLPAFAREREAFLEYDISQLIYQAGQLDRPVLGILTSLPIFGNPMMMPGQPMDPASGQEAALVAELRKTWDVRQIFETSWPDDLDVLAVIHPGNPSALVQYRIDQFLLSGKPVLLALDPSSFLQRSQQQSRNQQMMMMGGGGMEPTSSNLPLCLPAWGIEYDDSLVVGDALAGRIIQTRSGQAPFQYPLLLDLSDFGQDLPATSALNQLSLMEAGSFRLREGSALSFQPILQTSGQSGQVSSSLLQFSPLETVVNQFAPDAQTRTLAALVRGTFTSAFPEGEPASDTPPPGEETPAAAAAPADAPAKPSLKEGQSTLVLIADSDFLTDNFSVQYINFGGMRAIRPLNDNLVLASNLIDFIGGSEDLLDLRSKGRVSRPFTRIRDMELAAQADYQRELETLESRLTEVQGQLSELVQQQQDQQILVADPAIIKAIEDFQLQEAELRSERREIRKKLREDIERLELNLVLFNLLTMPLTLAAAGVIFFYRRGRRQRAA